MAKPSVDLPTFSLEMATVFRHGSVSPNQWLDIVFPLKKYFESGANPIMRFREIQRTQNLKAVEKSSLYFAPAEPR